MENIGGAHAVLAFHAQRQMGIGSAIGVQILGLAVIGLAPQLVEPGLGFLKGGEMLYRGLLLGIGGPCFQVGNVLLTLRFFFWLFDFQGPVNGTLHDW